MSAGSSSRGKEDIPSVTPRLASGSRERHTYLIFVAKLTVAVLIRPSSLIKTHRDEVIDRDLRCVSTSARKRGATHHEILATLCSAFCTLGSRLPELPDARQMPEQERLPGTWRLSAIARQQSVKLIGDVCGGLRAAAACRDTS